MRLIIQFAEFELYITSAALVSDEKLELKPRSPSGMALIVLAQGRLVSARLFSLTNLHLQLFVATLYLSCLGGVIRQQHVHSACIPRVDGGREELNH